MGEMPDLGAGLQGGVPSSFGNIPGMLAQNAQREALRKQLAMTMLLRNMQGGGGGAMQLPSGPLPRPQMPLPTNNPGYPSNQPTPVRPYTPF